MNTLICYVFIGDTHWKPHLTLRGNLENINYLSIWALLKTSNCFCSKCNWAQTLLGESSNTLWSAHLRSICILLDLTLIWKCIWDTRMKRASKLMRMRGRIGVRNLAERSEGKNKLPVFFVFFFEAFEFEMLDARTRGVTEHRLSY